MNRVLLAEDNPSLGHALQEVLRRHGFEATYVRDGPAALDQLFHQSFDAVLCDILLPGLNGMELLRKTQDLHDAPPIVLMTGGEDPGLEELAGQLHAYAFLRKPVGVSELISCLKSAVTP
jgi:two-component system OmpR family response regulator/two-component system response regulator QseB